MLVGVELEFSGEIIYWRGPSPFHFVTAPEEQSAAIEAVSSLVTYGWGAIPVEARIGVTDFRRRCSRRVTSTSCRSRPLSGAPKASSSATS